MSTTIHHLPFQACPPSRYLAPGIENQWTGPATFYKILVSKITGKGKIGSKDRKTYTCPGAPSKARVYTDVNTNRAKEYWDYESLNVQWG
ncbi:hypothetical protein L1887_31637 [Cichorium endivia]|nr:hypothetical protein L1887_31637 [Cichorium endivia]